MKEEIIKAKEVLRNAGYFVDNLWHIDDVDLDGASDEDKMQMLDDVLSSDYTNQIIFESIADAKEYYKFKKQKQ
jgi:hypothetical protein